MALSYKNDEDQDERLNPAADTARDLYRQEQTSYDREFGDIAANFDETADSSVENDNIAKTKNIDSAKDQEERGGWANKYTGENSGKQESTGKLRGLKKKGPIGLIIGLLLGGGGIGLFFGGTTLAPQAFAANVIGDLDDKLASLDIRNEHMLRNKIPKTDESKALAGCSKMSIRCKFKTISTKQAAKLKAAGIEVKGDTGGIFGKRIKPTTYSFNGRDYSPAEFASALRTDTSVRLAYKRGLNMKYLGLNDKTTITRVYRRFGISRKPPELKGTHQERVNALMNKAGTKDINDLNFKPATDDQGKEKPGVFVLEGDTSGTEYTQSQVDSMKKSIGRVKAAAAPPSRMTSTALKGLSALGYWDLACSVKNMIGLAAVSAKIANKAELIKYAAPVLSMIYKVRAGDASPEDGQVVGEFFSNPDNRKMVADIAKAAGTSGDSVPMVNNPYYGKNVMDSSLYQMSAYGGVARSQTNTSYSLGMGQNSLLAGVSDAAEISSVLVNLGTDNSICHTVQSWWARGIGFAVAVVGAVATGGASVGAQLAVTGGFMVAMGILDHIINSALDQGIISNDMDKAPEDRAAATWTGIAGIMGESAQAHGMMPGSSDQITAYQQLEKSSKQDYIALEQQDANPFDASNPYSFIGSMEMSMARYFPSSYTVASSFTQVPAFIFGSIFNAINPGAAYAATLDPARFKQCDDPSYTDPKIGIDADVQCNVRYVMPASDLALDTDAVAAYMEDHGYVAKETTTGLPEGYTPPDPVASQNFAMSLLNGFTSQFLDSRATMLKNDYAKFLDYCAYRTMPYGETYQENGAINGVEQGWLDGSNCRKQGAPYSYFRIYTMDKALNEAIDGEEPTDGPVAATTTASGEVSSEGWAFPTTPDAVITSGYKNPQRPNHRGVDLAQPGGALNKPIFAARDGVVVAAGPASGFGNWIVIQHDVNGQRVDSVYGHMYDDGVLVKKGDHVKAGQQIGKIGSNGQSTGPHLHFELWQGGRLSDSGGNGSGHEIDPTPILNKAKGG